MITHIAGEQHRFRLRVASRTEQGSRSANEDEMGMIDMGHKGFCCALADGAGGHGNGALAARLTIDTVLEGFHDNPLCAPMALASLISMAEHTVSEEQPTSVSRAHMSATVVLLCIDPINGKALWAHWGDSRLYGFRQSRVQVATEDHSVAQQLLHAGIYQPQDVRQLPNRNLLAGAIGAESQVPPSVQHEAWVLQAGDVFLLCSDGLWENLQEAQMEAALEQAPRPDVWLDDMFKAVLSSGKEQLDNLSALALWVSDDDDDETN